MRGNDGTQRSVPGLRSKHRQAVPRRSVDCRSNLQGLAFLSPGTRESIHGAENATPCGYADDLHRPRRSRGGLARRLFDQLLVARRTPARRREHLIVIVASARWADPFPSLSGVGGGNSVRCLDRRQHAQGDQRSCDELASMRIGHGRFSVVSRSLQEYHRHPPGTARCDETRLDCDETVNSRYENRGASLTARPTCRC